MDEQRLRKLAGLEQKLDESEMHQTDAWDVMLPANRYTGKYYDYGVIRVRVEAGSEKEAIKLAQKHRKILTKSIDAKKAMGGRRLVPKDVDKNLFFDKIRSAKPATLLSGMILNRNGQWIPYKKG
jgi:hypothetical protein